MQFLPCGSIPSPKISKVLSLTLLRVTLLRLLSHGLFLALYLIEWLIFGGSNFAAPQCIRFLKMPLDCEILRYPERPLGETLSNWRSWREVENGRSKCFLAGHLSGIILTVAEHKLSIR